ncbi:hypothetical protein LWI29_024766 [Acer saccharum]|uniref:Uncharacterized protein n=1 Tax=Acer saccharum TaxID=4024 RepID=A0AA39UVT9_ACESA|nr:hypothetical protein LWI29_024766 [Acer saccharum]
MDLANRFKNLFHSILSTIIQLLPASPPPPPPPNHEAAREYHPEPKPESEAPPLANYDQEKLDWAVRMICYCLPPAVSIAIQFLQNQSHELPLAFHSLSLVLILSFNFLFLSKFIAPKFPETAKLLERLGIAISNTTLSVQNFKAAMAVPSALGLDPTVANSGDKIKFLLIKAPLEDSYDLARAAFKVAEDFEVSIKLVNDVSSTLEKSQLDITTKYDYN